MMLLGLKLRPTYSGGISLSLRHITIHVRSRSLINKTQTAASMSVDSHARTQTAMQSSKLRVAVVQFAPKIGRVDENITKAREMCSALQPREVDLVCFPEMIFTGYVFSGPDHITPYLEDADKLGPTSTFCAELARRLECYVFAGYPERLSIDEIEALLPNDAKPRDDQSTGEADSKREVGANCAGVWGPDGLRVALYRKTNLFTTDMTWARAGTGFLTLSLPPPLSTLTLGICMDLNVQPPAVWGLDKGPYEIAQECRARGSNVLILLNAWLDSQEDVEDMSADWGTINYWAARLRPLWAKDEQETEVPEDSDGQRETQQHRTTVIICNRTGSENGRTFAGSSSLLEMKVGSGRPRLLDCMGRREEGVAVWYVAVP